MVAKITAWVSSHTSKSCWLQSKGGEAFSVGLSRGKKTALSWPEYEWISEGNLWSCSGTHFGHGVIQKYGATMWSW